MGTHVGYVVVLEEPVNDEYSFEHVITALKQIKGVVEVKPVLGSIDMAMAEHKVRHELMLKLYELAAEFGGRKK